MLSHVLQKSKWMADFPIPQTRRVQPDLLDDRAIWRHRRPDRFDRRLDVLLQLPLADVAFEDSFLLQRLEDSDSRGFGRLPDRLDLPEQLP